MIGPWKMMLHFFPDQIMERLVSRSKKLLDEAPTMDFADFAPWALADGSIGYGSMDPDGSSQKLVISFGESNGFGADVLALNDWMPT